MQKKNKKKLVCKTKLADLMLYKNKWLPTTLGKQ